MSAGLRASGSVTPAMDFYFDKETTRLHCLDWRGDFYRFSEWKEHDGLKYASKTILFKVKGGKSWLLHEITELERLTKLPEGARQALKGGTGQRSLTPGRGGYMR